MMWKNIILHILLLITLILLIKEVIKFISSSFISLCVFYTLSDLYKKRKIVFKWFNFCKKYYYFLYPKTKVLKSKNKTENKI